jgi:5,10-methylenetetrahydromethanopterin reductase
MPRSQQDLQAVARATEAGGFWGLGVGDSHFLYHELYTSITACLLGTSRVAVGPYVTNNVSRSWSVHAAAARALDELAPGRFFLGLATGDGSVHSVGQRPQRWADLEREIPLVRARVPRELEVHVTVSGPRGAATAARVADVVVIGVGADAGAIANLAEVARAQRAASCRPLEVWATFPLHVVEREDEVDRARDALLFAAIGLARFALGSTLEGKNVPPEHVDVLRQRLSKYSHAHHASRAADNPNAALFDDHPEVKAYLQRRMLMVGTAEACARALSSLAEACALDGVWLTLNLEDGAEVVERLASAVPCV